ncbi:phosphatidylcholine:ceramide cholinephosphotransferase 1 isoform X4 [Scyliorhinus canicula]|uniref:phosphatidylcholine:ceramide cholinephosphotransferase 1 isoform X4 n=1 Tax=Scyliorhinus canicula TaxID=7830 RepID=UPI0018F5D8C2|nr:phosphatidylcholine:ceramide cholinephosphotransferase 1 isoform X4 [Scyliorhinus canicula]
MTTIVSVPKKNQATCLNDYNPVALTPIIKKCLERLIMRRINSIFLECFHPLQFTYRRNQPTADSISLAVHTCLEHSNNKDSYVSLLLIDYSSIFNTIISAKFISKLQDLGLDSSLCNWILDFLTHRQQSLFGDVEAQFRRIMKMIAGGGLSITGAHTMCGDYLYSGHTVMLTLTYLFIKEYSPKQWWWYHWSCWILSIVGVFCILLAHDHYTVDVVVAYYITTRLFWWYHTMANQQTLSHAATTAHTEGKWEIESQREESMTWRDVNSSGESRIERHSSQEQVLKEPSETNFLSQVWWYKFFRFLESNVQVIVPRTYHLPLSWSSISRFFGRKVQYSRLAMDT